MAERPVGSGVNQDSPESYNDHWFVKYLNRPLAKKLPKKIKKQYRSLPGQQSLPGMEGEAERSMRKKKG